MAADVKDMKLEVVVFEVSDVERVKAFYLGLGWRLDGEFKIGDGFHAIQITPHHSEASIIFGKGVTPNRVGAAHDFVIAVTNLDPVREDLVARGIAVSEIFHYAGGPFNNSLESPRQAGRDPEGRTYCSFVSFKDPEGNEWLVQEIPTRLPGREWKRKLDVAGLADLLRETEEHHGNYEKTHATHHWSDWYAPYINARQNGSSAQEAAAAADSYMEKR